MTSHLKISQSSAKPQEIPCRSFAFWISFSWRARRCAAADGDHSRTPVSEGLVDDMVVLIRCRVLFEEVDTDDYVQKMRQRRVDGDEGLCLSSSSSSLLGYDGCSTNFRKSSFGRSDPMARGKLDIS